MRARALSLVVVALAGLATACGDDHIRIRTVAPVAFPGATMQIQLISKSDRPIFYNLCPAIFQRRTSGGWRTVEEALPEGCPQHLLLLPPREEIIEEIGVPDVLSSGAHRVEFEVIWFREERSMPPIPIDPLPVDERRTNSFEIIASQD